jgi:hypothetical protein
MSVDETRMTRGTRTAPHGPDFPVGPRGPRHARRRRRRRVVALILALLMVAPTVSYVNALTYPGNATWQVRTVDWIRNNNGSAVVNAVENWYYTLHQPAAGPPDPATLPQVPGGVTTAGPAPLPLLPGAKPLPGEGAWAPGRIGADGRPLLYRGYLRPDPKHLSVVVGVAWMRAGGTVGHLVAGTTEPGGRSWPEGSQVPSADVPGLVATFNSGFKLRDISGGFYADGRTARPLVNGQASLVIDRQGNVSVGQWGRDFSMNPNVAAVRQNLALVVNGGEPVPGLNANTHGRWGNAKNQYQYTWRSGVGTDAAGNLIYVAGAGMNLTTLATSMVHAGIVRGMQLDIHPGMASFASWLPSTAATPAPTKLLPAMSQPADRYLLPDQRDFIYLTVR